jgi:hypothetical protein
MANLSNINNKLIVTDGGNLLVNKTAANNAAVGVQLMSTGDVNGTVSGDTVARFNRLSDDGEIIRFQQDTSTDGAINSLSGRIAIGSGTTGVFFDSIRDVLTPHNMTTNAYSTNISLGRDLIRFKDLYLSGIANIAGSVTTQQINLNSAGGGVIDNQTGNIFIQTSAGSGWIFRNGASGYVEKMRIDASGNMTLSTTAASASNGGILKFNSSNSASGSYVGTVRFDGTHTPSSTIYTGPSINAVKQDANYATALTFKTTDGAGAVVERMRISGYGDVSITAAGTNIYANEIEAGATTLCLLFPIASNGAHFSGTFISDNWDQPCSFYLAIADKYNNTSAIWAYGIKHYGNHGLDMVKYSYGSVDYVAIRMNSGSPTNRGWRFTGNTASFNPTPVSYIASSVISVLYSIPN